MADATVQRRLAAILTADVAGFSTLMERDEEGTYSRIGKLRREIIEPRLSEHQGRLIKTTGDGFLAEFASPIAALRCALASRAPSPTIRMHFDCGSGLTSATSSSSKAVTSMARVSTLPRASKASPKLAAF